MVEFSFSEYRARQQSEELRECWLASRAATERMSADPSSARLTCEVCGSSESLGQISDWREGMTCSHCGFSARIRATVGFMQRHCSVDADVYITEQATSLYAWLQKRWPRIQGSEYADDPERLVELSTQLHHLGGSGEVAFQDVTKLGWEDASLDAVVSGDVLEHVPNYHAALAQFARVLRPDGVLMATFPFTDDQHTIVRARLGADGSIEHLMPPEYHGDPISGGVLCFYHFGWDILDSVRAAGFRRAEMVMPWVPQAGIYFGNWTLVATR